MMLSTALWAAVGAFAISTSALWSNHRRPINRTLAIMSLYVAGWLLCLHGFIIRPGEVKWLRAAWIAAGFYPLALWLVRDVILDPEKGTIDRLKRIRFWWLYPVSVAGLACSPWFVSVTPLSVMVYHPGYYVVVLAGLGVHAWLTGTTMWRLQGQIGIRRLELQLLLLGGVLSAIAAHGLLGLAAVLQDDTWEKLMPFAVLALYGGMVWSLLTTRLLDATHIVTIGVEKLVLTAAVSFFIWGTQHVVVQFMPVWLAFGTSLGFGLWFASVIRPRLKELTHRKATGERVHLQAFEIAREELRPELMENAFVRLLCEWSNCDRTAILMASQGRLMGGGIEWALDRPELKLLHALRWVTPERLERERPRAHGRELAALLRKEGLGIVVASSGPSLAFAVALSTPRTKRPYTYTEIGRLLPLETTIENALSRGHYLMKAQHAEQLATVGLLGASIAHEIRNPLVSIKTFVQLLPHHYQEAAFREKFFRLIGEEVDRIDRLTEQLLDLAAPRVFTAQQIALHVLLSECIDLVAAKAEDKGVTIIKELKAQPDVVYTDPNAIKQVVLNLSFNALQALEPQMGARWIRFETKQVPAGVEVTVQDNGPGISEEVRSRLFQPFQSTKSSGFGLGLAICKDILSNLHASITADPPQPGRGATFRIILPCQPPIS